MKSKSVANRMAIFIFIIMELTFIFLNNNEQFHVEEISVSIAYSPE